MLGKNYNFLGEKSLYLLHQIKTFLGPIFSRLKSIINSKLKLMVKKYWNGFGNGYNNFDFEFEYAKTWKMFPDNKFI